jgi:26S proteasome regulatory subunit N9
MSSHVDQMSASVSHCEAMAAQFPDLAEPYYDKIASYCQQKLWHQLTLAVLDFVGNPKTNLRILDAELKNTFVAMYQKVVLVVAPKLNALSLARIASSASASSLASGSITVDESKALLQELLEKQETGKPHTTATTLFLQSKIGLLQLQHTQDASKEGLAETYTLIKTNAPLLNQLLPDTPEAMVVNASHYEMSMTYYKLIGPPEAYYNEAIHYLNYYQPTAENATQSHALAVDLCLAALTGEGVYNLGQVVTNPIVQVLQGTTEAWLVELLQACAKGSVAEFKTLCSQTYPSQIASQPALVHMGQQMQEKMTLLALVEMVFERPASERTLEFADIATRLEIPMEQVEWVLMRAFSVKLMEGIMDQVDGTVHITWVLPRTLTNEQMADLANRFGEWAGKVSKTKSYMQEHATLSA